MSKIKVSEFIDTDRKPDWDKVYNFVKECGKAHNPRAFASEIITHAEALYKYDEALVYFIDGNGKVVEQELRGIQTQYSNLYLDSFAYDKGNPWNLDRDYRENTGGELLHYIIWDDSDGYDFTESIVKPRGLKSTVSLFFYDLYGSYRMFVCLDRTNERIRDNIALNAGGITKTEDGLLNLYWAMPLLADLYKNFYYMSDEKKDAVQAFTEENSPLTRREVEIANLLCQGVSPANISSTLYISTSTTYKHIANIYEKLHVKSQRELLALMLNR